MSSQMPVLRSMGCPFGTGGGISLLSETFVDTRKCIHQSPSWTPTMCTSIAGTRNLRPQCHGLYKSHLPALAEPFLGCFSASSIGRDTIWCIFDHILKHSPVSSGNKTRNDNEGTISHSTSKGFFSRSVTDAPTLSARKDGEFPKFLGFLQLFWRAFVPSTRNAASSRIRVLLHLEKVICRTRKRKGDGTEKCFAGKIFA